MAYRIERATKVGDELRRIVVEQLDAAVQRLSETGSETASETGSETGSGTGATGRAEAVHDARKRLKKARAVLRLGRGDLSAADYRRENGAYRDAGRLLAGMRDAQVLVDTVEWLRQRARGTTRRLEAVASVLEERRSEDPASQEETIAAAVPALRDARGRVDDWRFTNGGWDVLVPGLERSYRQGRRGLRTAQADASVETLHTWRKRVKDTWYHSRLLTPVWPRGLKATANAASDLADILGRDHDLAVLVGVIADDPDAFGSLMVRDVTTRATEHRQILQAEAFGIGHRLYAEGPGAYRTRLANYWNTWAGET